MRKGKELNINFRDGFKKLSEAEQKHNFFATLCEGIPLWLYGRDRALNIVSGITSYEGQSISTHKINPLNLAGRILYFLFNFYKLFNNDIIIFTNERHLEKDTSTNRYYNPFAEMVLDLNKRPKKPLIFEFPIPMTKKYKKVGYRRYLTIDLLLLYRQLFYPFSWLYYNKTKKDLESKLNLSGLFEKSETKEILNRCHRSVHSIKCFAFFLKLVKYFNPRAKLIYSCMGGFDKFLGVIEIQPALIIDCQSVYIYPQTPQIQNYLRDKKMIVFSEGTRDLLVKNGYIKNNFIISENPKIKYYFLKNIGSDFYQKKNFDKKIVIVGNWGGSLQKIMNKAVSEIEKNQEKFDGWDISMVLHPTEKNTYKTLNLKKIKVYENHEVSLWKILAEAICTIDIASTVIKESEYFGCFNIILKDKKFDDQSDFINALSEGYSFKEVIDPENLAGWFDKNNERLKAHASKKKEILKDNYEYFKNNVNKNSI